MCQSVKSVDNDTCDLALVLNTLSGVECDSDINPNIVSLPGTPLSPKAHDQPSNMLESKVSLELANGLKRQDLRPPENSLGCDLAVVLNSSKAVDKHQQNCDSIIDLGFGFANTDLNHAFFRRTSLKLIKLRNS